MDELSSPIKKILNYDEAWCNFFNIYNPYLDAYDYHLAREIPVFDGQAFKKYPKHNFVYDKLWIAQSQNIKSGEIKQNSLPKKDLYPVFIKPRWGHQTATSKNCFKIKTPEEIVKFIDVSDMIWTEYIDETEGMTDYILLHGQSMFQMTLQYSDKQLGFIDEWKYVSEENTPPDEISKWVDTYLSSYTGIANIQYRGNKIIEVSLRLARGGAYIISTDNKHIVNNINQLVKNNEWNHTVDHQLTYKPFYSFKCYTAVPIIFLIPQFILDHLIKIYNGKEFYEYYFEPNGKNGMVFFQFMHSNYNEAISLKNVIENLFVISQIFFYIALFVIIPLFGVHPKLQPYKIYVISTIIILFITTLLNPLSMQYNIYKSQKQRFTLS